MNTPAPLYDEHVSGEGEESITVPTVPGIVSLPDCNVYKTCEVCERGNTSTGIECPNCGHVNSR